MCAFRGINPRRRQQIGESKTIVDKKKTRTRIVKNEATEKRIRRRVSIGSCGYSKKKIKWEQKPIQVSVSTQFAFPTYFTRLPVSLQNHLLFKQAYCPRRGCKRHVVLFLFLLFNIMSFSIITGSFVKICSLTIKRRRNHMTSQFQYNQEKKSM